MNPTCSRPSVARLIPSLLYLVTGVATGAQSWWVVSWAWLGRSPGLPELVALLGSTGLLASAGLNLINPRRAALTALAATLAVWPFYAAAAWETSPAARRGNEAVEVVFARLEPGSEPLVIVPNMGDKRPFAQLTEDEVARLHILGIGGRLKVTGATVMGGGEVGHANASSVQRARVIVVLSEQLRTSPVALRQPDHVSLIYLQRGSDWVASPPDAPTIDQKITLEVANHTQFQTWYAVEWADGSRTGGTAFVWPEPTREPYK